MPISAFFFSDEADALYEGLKKHKTFTAKDVEEKRQQELANRERFLELYPSVKSDIEQHIKHLYSLADRADHVHKDCTTANVVADSTGILSGILTIAGFGLAPFTAGLSLALSATGLGLGVVATSTNVVSSIVENSNMSSIEAEATDMESSGINFNLIGEVISDNKDKFSSVKKSYKAVRRIARHIRAMRVTSLSSKTAAQISAQSSSMIDKVFGGTAKAMTKGARIIGGATIGLSVLVDIYSLVQDSKDLHEGAVSETGEKLRQHAQELEKMLVELKQIHENLQ